MDPTKVIIVPGNGGSGDIRDSNFYGWAEHQLKTSTSPIFNVIMPSVRGGMPDPYYARRNIWIPYILNDLKCERNTVLIGHSSGSVAALKIAEVQKLKGLVLIATYDHHMDDEMEAASGYFDEPFNWELIKQNCGFILQFAGVKDRLVPIDMQRKVAEYLKPKVEYFEMNRDHFFEPPFDELISAIKDNCR
jgi:predicted alpha/beta hydrolase family esterase